MARVKKGLTKRARHKRILKLTAGFRGAKNRLVRVAHEAMLHSGQYAFAGRKLRKRDMRALWIERINAGLGLTSQGVSYSRFIKNLKDQKVELDRKILSDLAYSDMDTFTKVVEKVSK
ncbi:MAG: 50S ribosomal protein L20 [Candidatus Woykebacteria bacterium RIFCSPHIGHO2_12_FULL_43_10]|uniref:Large ribosomal subunit protein bL20 n=2 Tax=Candidatus Woykeibacteriota TaxID=1817899 RepID=A0A1G1WWS2_9BACT|nr:MAG: 50S ribosomal protein L20 [Candidatus Woykebacteria bacterium RIFCSPHIGHO2_02_FULL_43_16b]OGY28651.1 MAG: 50S ribosomal protein L20 [Candidatus Woykebacteria bacterium RIFCSPHIGHO2_01_FULL_43_29]OGY28786.1 MAG: 50S ribosomal protein L20 [Candidatus Woykebacteria bacterium RIFCSPHIGHO2_12_FULL_43_10]OGY32192.1 MAG: 50S ribosomal protein L20 [Candidatus Woykebacteria bacterium RIFCSPLOWO2_01_FULL_43_14]